MAAGIYKLLQVCSKIKVVIIPPVMHWQRNSLQIFSHLHAYGPYLVYNVTGGVLVCSQKKVCYDLIARKSR